MFGNIDFKDVLVIALVCLLLFGAKKLPMLGRSVGQSITEFRKAFSLNSDDNSIQRESAANGPAKPVEKTNS